jgi:hypothetical protein
MADSLGPAVDRLQQALRQPANVRSTLVELAANDPETLLFCRSVIHLIRHTRSCISQQRSDCMSPHCRHMRCLLLDHFSKATDHPMQQFGSCDFDSEWKTKVKEEGKEEKREEERRRRRRGRRKMHQDLWRGMQVAVARMMEGVLPFQG